MNIDDLTIGEAKQLAGMFGKESTCEVSPWRIGKNYLIRTVTMILTGRLTQVTRQELVLEDAAWIADTGRFMQAVADGNFKEVEPFPDGPVIVGRGALIDAVMVSFAVPRSQK